MERLKHDNLTVQCATGLIVGAHYKFFSYSYSSIHSSCLNSNKITGEIQDVWLGGAVVRALDLGLKGHGFKSQPLHCRVQLWTSCSHI